MGPACLIDMVPTEHMAPAAKSTITPGAVAAMAVMAVKTAVAGGGTRMGIGGSHYISSAFFPGHDFWFGMVYVFLKKNSMNKVKFLLAAVAVCIGISSCHTARTGPGRPYTRQTKYHASVQQQPVSNTAHS